MNNRLNILFQQYIDAFQAYDYNGIRDCYHLPCVLHTPEKIAYLSDEQVFKQEVSEILLLLKNAKIKHLQAINASYDVVSEHSINACIDWEFIDTDGKVFTDFTAFYQIENIKENFKIISVVSHDLSNSVKLNNTLNIAKHGGEG